MYANQVPQVAEEGFFIIINVGIPDFNTTGRGVIQLKL